MDTLIHINQLFVWIGGALTLFGLYRPWLALWWLPVTNRKKVLQYYGVATLVGLVTYAGLTLATGSAPRHLANDASPRVLFYLHGRIVEEQGAHAVSERYGRYEYDSIVKVLEGHGFMVKSEVRPSNTDIHQYADDLTRQIRALIDTGTAAENVTVVGASKGAVIAMLVATRLQNPAINFVLIAGCNEWVEEELKIDLCGRILSIYEASDEIGRSCEAIFRQSSCQIITQEIKLNTGLKHGVLYRPLPEWISPTVRWALLDPVKP